MLHSIMVELCNQERLQKVEPYVYIDVTHVVLDAFQLNTGIIGIMRLIFLIATIKFYCN